MKIGETLENGLFIIPRTQFLNNKLCSDYFVEKILERKNAMCNIYRPIFI